VTIIKSTDDSGAGGVVIGVAIGAGAMGLMALVGAVCFCKMNKSRQTNGNPTTGVSFGSSPVEGSTVVVGRPVEGGAGIVPDGSTGNEKGAAMKGE